MLKVNEVFHSIQGESTYAGLPTVFVRLTGCHLRCHYCDTQYAYFEGEKRSQEDVLETIAAFNARYVCITGGEPLLQQKACLSLMTELCNRNYNVSLETSGAVSIAAVDPRVKIILDIKTPDSGAENSFLFENLEKINVNTEFKFVICSESDFHWAESFVRENKISENHCVLYSPSFGKISEKWLAKKILSESSKARLQLQLHKYIWSEHQRGV